MRSTHSRTLGVLLAAATVMAACGSDSTTADTTAGGSTADTTADGESTPDTAGESSTSDAAPSSGWTVSVDDCVDPDRATAPIEGTVKIGAWAPLSGGPVVSAFQPVVDGYKAYIDYANQEGLLEGYQIELDLGDDQYNPSETPGVVNGLLDDGVDVIGGGIGTANGLAVRSLLNEECIPQLAPVTGALEFGEPDDFPWTMSGINLTYPVEAAAYADRIAESFDGATVGVFSVNTELGLSYVDGFIEAADSLGLTIVSEQTIEQGDSAPPAAQVSEIAREAPDAIFAVPVGGNCPTFLSELANAKAANPGWEPVVYITSTCSSPAVLEAAGDAATGIFTSTPGHLITADSDVPAVQEFFAIAESVGLNPGLFEAAGWTIGEIVVETLRQAAASGEMTRVSIIEAARSMDFQPSLYREGVSYKTSGLEDAIGLESIQVVEYDATAKTYTEIGDLVTKFESS